MFFLESIGQVRADPGFLELAKESGCLACHSLYRTVVGPAFKDVSEHYKGVPGAREMLINKIHTGGRGNWTSVSGGATMPPYSPRVSDANIEKLVDFVLALSEPEPGLSLGSNTKKQRVAFPLRGNHSE